MTKIGIVNYGMGNIASVQNALAHVGFDSFIIQSTTDFLKADKLILPGVGAFARAMENIKGSGLSDALSEEVLIKKKNILGLCLGMQLMFETSEEHGLNKGFGWIEGSVKDMRNDVKSLPVPHMGWNRISYKKENPLFQNLEEEQADFYFVHSYYCKCKNDLNSIAQVKYGVSFDVAIQKENVFGCQFHPEKSQKNGLQLLKNFCEL